LFAGRSKIVEKKKKREGGGGGDLLPLNSPRAGNEREEKKKRTRKTPYAFSSRVRGGDRTKPAEGKKRNIRRKKVSSTIIGERGRMVWMRREMWGGKKGRKGKRCISSSFPNPGTKEKST